MREAIRLRSAELKREQDACNRVAAECAIERKVEARQRVSEQIAERRQRVAEQLAVKREIQRRVSGGAS